MATAVVALVCVACAACAEDDVDRASGDAVAPGDAAATATPDGDAPDDGEAAPVEFLELRAEEITDVRAVVRFDTSVETTCAVEYGVAVDALDESATDPNMAEDELAISHEVPLEDLSPATTYHWRPRVVDAAGAVTLGEVRSFTTLDADVGPAARNVALIAAGAVVIDASSNFGGAGVDSAWGAARAFDGEMATEWSTAGDGDDAHVTLQLAAPTSLTHVAFRSRKMADGSSIVTAFRLVVDETATLGPFATPDPDQRYRFELPEPIVARIVRFEAVETTGGNTGAKEIELLAAH